MKLKNSFWRVIIIIIILFIGIMFFAQKHTWNVNLNVSEHQNNTIVVSGKAEKYISPDIANISFNVTKKSYNQKDAAEYVNKTTKKVIEKLKELGIEEKDIKTKNYSLRPEYKWNDGDRHFIGYRVSQAVNVKIRDLSQAPKILTNIVNLKVDNINGPNFAIDNVEKIKENLRKEAIDDAKIKARRLAFDLGVNLDKIVLFSENQDRGYNYPIYSKMATMSDAVGFENDVLPTPEINPGEQKITKTVSITYQIED